MARIAINGFGRIGRSFFRKTFGTPKMEIVAINDLTDPANLAYLLKYDSVYGRYGHAVGSKEGALVVGDQEVKVLAEKDPSKLPWRDLGVDIVIESTGFFATAQAAQAHIDAGAKRVVITAPASGDGVTTALVGVNDERFETANSITSNGSCTTNSVVSVLYHLHSEFTIKKADMTTVHGYTATQKIVDGPDPKDYRRGRAAAANIVPSTTGAADAVLKAIPDLEGIFSADSVRIPVIAGSLSIITALVERATVTEEINNLLAQKASEPRWARVLSVTEDQLVSSDILGQPYGAIVDLSLTRVTDTNLVKVFAWYDNESGYTATLVEHVKSVMAHL